MRYTTCCKPLISCVAPSLVEVEVVVLRLWFTPSSERWRLVVTLLGRGVGCLAKGLPLLCEVVFVLGEEFGTPCVVTNPLR